MTEFCLRIGPRSFVEMYRAYESWGVGFKVSGSGVLVHLGSYALNARWWVP